MSRAGKENHASPAPGFSGRCFAFLLIAALGLASCGWHVPHETAGFCPEPGSIGKDGSLVPDIGKADLIGFVWSTGTNRDPEVWRAVWNASIPDSIRAEVRPLSLYGAKNLGFSRDSVKFWADTSFRIALAADTAGLRP